MKTRSKAFLAAFGLFAVVGSGYGFWISYRLEKVIPLLHDPRALERVALCLVTALEALLCICLILGLGSLAYVWRQSRKRLEPPSVTNG